MKKVKTIVNKSACGKKPMGRPRSVSDNGNAPAVAVRLPLDVLERVDRIAAESGKRRSDVIRDLVTAAVARLRSPGR